MNNFLQRIVSSVAPGQQISQPRLQPILRSVFAPIASLAEGEMHEAPGHSFNFNENAAYHSQTNEAGGRAASSLLHGLLFSPSQSEDPTSVLHDSSAQPLNVENYWPLLPRNATPHGDRNATPVANAVAQESGHPFGTVNREESSSGTAPESLTSTPTGDNSQATSNPSSRGPQPLLAHAALMPSRIVPMRSAPTEPQRQVRREPDEIHIHIGRIDVAAVAPSTPRAPAPQPRKSLSLDEYLRRGTGGQG